MTVEQQIFFSEKYVLLDHGGTIGSFDELDKLLDFFLRSFEEYLENHWYEQELQALIRALKKQNREDLSNNIPGLVEIVEGPLEKESIFRNVIWHVNLGRKSTAITIIRKLQNLLWTYGFQSNLLKVEIFKDIKPAMKLWKDCGKRVFCYSTASVQTQKSVLENTNEGDLSQFLSGYFDLEDGSKVEPSSYEHIADKLGCSSQDILFITDLVSEAEAAAKAGCKVAISLRPGNAPLSDEDRGKHICITGFDRVIPGRNTTSTS